MKRDINFWLIQVPGWLLLCYLVYAQAIPAFNYETGVDMGTVAIDTLGMVSCFICK